MISVEQHRERILAAVRPLPTVSVPVTQAHGCVLAADVIAAVPLPGFDNSAMDGYVVHAVDVASLPEPGGGGSAREAVDEPDANVVRLPVLGDIPAGDRRRLDVPPGHAYRIMTGAPMPSGAEVIVPVELTDGGLDQVTLRAADAPGRHVRRAGEDVHAGDVVLQAGRRLGSRQLALAASVGAGEVLVRPRPRIVCLSTGDELVAPGSVPGFGQVVDSNGLMLATALREAGFDAFCGAVVRDTEDAVIEALTAHLPCGPADRGVDAIVTTGGVSMGAYDAVKAALSRLGSVAFDKVAMQPGKPQGFGMLRAPGSGREVPVFTLPGNPVSALVSAQVFVVPALRLMAGRPVGEVEPLRAQVLDGWRSPPDRAQYVRVHLDRGDCHGVGATIRSAGGQGSHVLQALADANALAVVPAAVRQVNAGDVLDCVPFGAGDWRTA